MTLGDLPPRPLFLGIMTLLGIVVGALIAAWHSFAFFMGHETIYLAFVAVEAIAVAAFVGLRLGQLWGWILIQIFPFAILLFQSICIVLCSSSSSYPGAVIGTAMIIGMPPLICWVYIYTRRVRSFCSLSRLK